MIRKMTKPIPITRLLCRISSSTIILLSFTLLSRPKAQSLVRLCISLLDVDILAYPPNVNFVFITILLVC